MKKLIVVLAGVLMLGVTICSAPANGATTPEPTKLCADWTARGATGKYPDVSWGAPGPGTKLDGTTAKLVKPTSGTDPGVELAAKNLDLEWVAPVDISVHYALKDGASYSAGAVRLFYYEADNPNTLTDTPDKFDAALTNVGVLKIDNVLKIGTIGLVYDASNTSAGSVTFVKLRIKGMGVDLVVPFTNSCPSPSPSPTPSATSPSPSVSPSTSASTSPSTPAPSISTSPAAGPSLPVTGSSSKPWLIGLGVLVLGGALVGAAYLWRARRTRFEA